MITSQILRMDLVHFFVPSTFQPEQGSGRDEEEGIFSPTGFQCAFA